MKTRNLLVLLSVIFFGANHLFATDRVVQQGGPVGTYGSISAAITAAVDGDNIVINNRTDLLAWSENLTINKSLTLVSAVDNVQWWMSGTITIALAEGRNVSFVGMKGGYGITKTGANPVNRTNVSFLYCDMGDVNMVSGVNLHIGSCKANNITFSYGKIIGNDLWSVTCGSDAIATEDVNLIIGNRIGYFNSQPVGCSVTSTTQYFFLSNNYIIGTSVGLDISNVKSGAVSNQILNNTAVPVSSSTTSAFGARFLHSTGDTQVLNNAFANNYLNVSSGSNGVYVATSAASVTSFLYNQYRNFNTNGTNLNGAQGNISSTYPELDNLDANGGFVTGTTHVNAGSPLNDYLDLDLTRNDVGIYGGSYSLTNFLPFMSNPESSRVNYVSTPRVVFQGNTMNVQSIGVDK